MSILTETENYVYDQFEKICENSNTSEIETFIKKFNIDVNQNNGYYIELICLRDDLDMLQMVMKYNANIHIDNERALRITADIGLLNIVTYLLNNCNSNYKVLYGTSSYSNKPLIKQYIDSYSKSH